MKPGSKALLIVLAALGTTASRAEAQYLGLTHWTTGPGANGHWYAITQSAGDFRVLRDLAWSLGGNLVSITSADENVFVYSNFVALGTCAPVWCAPATFYIGLQRTSSGGPFAWLTGEPLVFTAWNPGEPNDMGDEEVAHMFGEDGQVKWNDIAFDSNPMRGVIEWDDKPSVAPEPAAITLLGTGLAGIGGLRLRSRRRRGKAV